MMHPQARYEASDSSAANSDSCVASLTIDYEEIVGSHPAKAGYHASEPDVLIPPSPNGR